MSNFSLIEIFKKIKPLGFNGLSIYDVTIFFIKGLQEGAITTRASSLAFNFFFSIFSFSNSVFYPNSIYTNKWFSRNINGDSIKHTTSINKYSHIQHIGGYY